MNLPRLALLALTLSLASVASPAHADLAPPRIQPVAKPQLPLKVKAWFDATKAALKVGTPTQARALCDERGFDQNLAGSDGTTLASLFAQGHRKKWHLRADTARSKHGPNKSYIAAADVVSDDGAKLDALFVLLVPTPDGTYVALGASESKAAVESLAKRWKDGAPLAPPSED